MTGKHKTRWAIAAGAALLLFVGGYIASPFLALARLADAVRTRDFDTIKARVDFEALRHSLARQIVNAGPRGAPQEGDAERLAQALALASPILEAKLAEVLTPERLTTLVEKGWPEDLACPSGMRFSGLDLDKSPLRYVQLWYFVGASRFTVRVGEGNEARDWAKLQLRLRNGTWRLHDVFLPHETRVALARVVKPLT